MAFLSNFRRFTNLKTCAVIGIAILGIAARRYFSRRSFPQALKLSHRVLFGNVEGDFRGTNPSKLMNPPKAREDPYFWLRDETRQKSEVLSFIDKENQFTNQYASKLEGLRQDIYNEFLSHFKETDTTVPALSGPYLYYTRTEKGKSYKIYCRKKGESGQEEIILDVNQLAEGKKYCDIGDLKPSSDHQTIAFTMDETGYETYSIFFKDMRTGEILNFSIPETDSNIEWGTDSSTIYYAKLDDEHRSYQLWRQQFQTDEKSLLYTEEDARMWLHFSKSQSKSFLLMRVAGKITSETYFIDLRHAEGWEAHQERNLICVQPRIEGMRYSVEHHDDYLYILTNIDNAENMRLVRAPISHPGVQQWCDFIPYDRTKKLDYILPFQDFLVISGRENGLQQVWIKKMNANEENNNELIRVTLPDPTYGLSIGENLEFDTQFVRLEYSSMTTPKSIWDFNMKTQKRILLKEQEVPIYDRGLYTSERLFATARDGTKIPISIVYKREFDPKNSQRSQRPLFLYGYGSYGHCLEPTFDFTRLSFLDRGVAYAIAHVRGGAEMGRHWYEDEGKFLKKKNTFTDFCDCAEFLINNGYTTANEMACCGRSAGGLLIAAAVNMRPDLFKVAVLDVPFVDVINTMSDSSIPLTVTEWEEWGNPNEQEFFEYMLGYSPYDNITEQNYPSMLVTGGLHDPRVSYWEPCKYVAKLRELKTDNNPLLLKIDVDSGHFSASDRYKYFSERALEYAFVLDQFNSH